MSLGITYILLSGQPQLLKPSDVWLPTIEF